MSIFNPNVPSDSEVKKPDQPIPDPKDRVLDTVAHDTRDLPINNLLTEIDGFPWTVDYYHRLYEDDDAVDGFYKTRNPVHQQYHKVLGFELRVQSAFSYSYEKTRQKQDLDGTAVIIPGTIIPNRGDVIIADIGQGHKVHLSVIDSAPLSILAQSAYEITYRTINVADAEFLTALERCVVKSSYFNKDFTRYNTSPIISTGTQDVYKTLNTLAQQLIETYGNAFISKQTNYLQVPGQRQNTVDIYLAKFINQFLETTQYPSYAKANWPLFPFTADQPKLSLWDILLRGDKTPLEHLKTHTFLKTGLVGTVHFRNQAWYTSIYFSSIVLLVYPVLEEGTFTNRMLPLSGDIVIETADDVDDTVSPDFHPVNQDDYYVLSKAFYLRQPEDQSLLEQMISNMINRQAIAVDIIIQLAEKLPTLPALERFYYTPLVLMLIRHVTRSL